MNVNNYGCKRNRNHVLRCEERLVHKIPKKEWHHYERKRKNVKARCPPTLEKFISKTEPVNKTKCCWNCCTNSNQERMLPRPVPNKLRVRTEPSYSLSKNKQKCCDCQFFIHCVRLFPLRGLRLFLFLNHLSK